MCQIRFQIKGQKENLLILAKEGKGVEFKGNNTICSEYGENLNIYFLQRF